MSNLEISFGVMAVLETPLTEERCEIINEQLHDCGSNLRVNYEGTILYSNKGTDDIDDFYGIRFSPTVNQSPSVELLSSIYELPQILKNQLSIRVNKPIKPYFCIWHNGSDSDMDLLTMKEFLGEEDAD